MTVEERDLRRELSMKVEELRKECTDKVDALVEEYNDKIAELQKKSNKRWKPEKINERYYRINPIGEVDCISFQNDTIDKRYYDFHNMFKTKEEAEFAAERWRVMRELEILSDDDKEWNGSNTHWCIEYDASVRNIYVNAYNYVMKVPFNIYFSSDQQAKKAIDAIGKERLEKYYFAWRNNHGGYRVSY